MVGPVVLALLVTACSQTADTALPASPSGDLPPAPEAAFDDATIERFQQVLDDARAKFDFPGVIVGVWSPDGTWIGSSGTKGVGQTGSPTPSDHTRIGSLTKTMTVTVLLQLMEEGKLSLDDTIGSYIPGVPNGDVATLRQLADMTSGIPSYTAEPAFLKDLFANVERQWEPAELVSFVKGGPPMFAPGEGWSYSNSNTVLLGMVIEQVTGKPIHEVYQERLFDPLGMSQTSFPKPGTTEIPDPHLFGITAQGQPTGKTADATYWNPSYSFTAGEVISTLDDLRTWSVALRTGEGILDASTQRMRMNSLVSVTTGEPEHGDGDGYGLGIGRRGGWWGHTGEIFGYNTVVNFLPDSGTTVIVVVNSDIALGDNPKTAVNPAPGVFAGLAEVLGEG